MTRPKQTPDLIDLLDRRDKAREYFDLHPESYHAMADWETADGELRKALREAGKSTVLHIALGTSLIVPHNEVHIFNGNRLVGKIADLHGTGT